MATATTTLALPDGNSATCWLCWRSLADALRAAEGIKSVTRDNGDLLHPALIVTYDTDRLASDAVARLVAAATETQATQHSAHAGAQLGMARSVPIMGQSDRESLAPTMPDVTASLTGRGITPSDRPRLLFAVSGMDCADCATSIERQVGRVPGVSSARVNLMAATLTVEPVAAADAVPPGVPTDQQDAALAVRIQQAVRDAGYGATPLSDATASGASGVEHARLAPLLGKERLRDLAPTALAALLWLGGFFLARLGAPTLASDALYALAIVIGGYRIARAAYFALVRGRTIGIDLLMSLAVVGAALIGQWAEGAAVVVLFATGEALESLTMDRTRRAIASLLDLSPREATQKTATGERRVRVEELAPGDLIIVRPGETVAADGLVAQGATTINQAPITGESLPVEKSVGDPVFAGTINAHGVIEVTVTKLATDSTLARIVMLVQEAQQTKAPSQRFVDRFAAIYTPAVVALAALVAVVPLLFGQPFEPWFYRALVLLVIACPCALVISTPVAIVAAVGRASRLGALVKGGAYLEALGDVRALAFDKTGTLTEGRPGVTDVIPIGDVTTAELLTLAAAVESRSEHPLASAVVRAAESQGLRWADPQDFAALPGRGARASVQGIVVEVGSPETLTIAQSDTPPEATTDAPSDGTLQARVADLRVEGKTVLLVARAGTVVGLLALADEPRPHAAQAIFELKAMGLGPIVMLSGDHSVTAQAIARRLGIDDVSAELLPERKAEAVRALQASERGVVMVGDGINDAPALAAATVGVAMGVVGSDTAIETADVALMSNDLTKLATLIRLSRATRATIRVNIAFSLLIKAAFLLLTLIGVVNLWLAILADTGAALLVIAYSMRLLRFGATGEAATPHVESSSGLRAATLMTTDASDDLQGARR